MLARIETVSEVVLIRSFESSSSTLVLDAESLLERRSFRMQRDRVDLKPILGRCVCVDLSVQWYRYVLGGVKLVLVLMLMEAGIAVRIMGLRYMN